MTPFFPFSEPDEVEFFSVIDYLGQKCVHLHGYTYKSDDYWANMEACGIIIPISEFVSGYAQRGMEFVDEEYECAKQYQGDYDDAGIVDVINHYYRDIVFPAREDNPEGMPDGWLDYGKVNEDTPYGQYIC